MKIKIAIDDDLKLKQRAVQPTEEQISNIIFNTGDKQLDVDLDKFFKNLASALQKKHEGNGGKGELEMLYVQILRRTEDVADHKVLPEEAIMMMFEAGTSVDLDAKLVKRSEFTEEQLKDYNDEALLMQSLQQSQQSIETVDLDTVMQGIEDDVDLNL